jgi:hypothetical protein
MAKLKFEDFDMYCLAVAGDTGTDILSKEQNKIIADAADKDCRYCDGTGIFYGNVTICTCTLAEGE